jgi:hypothetical protein
VVSILSYHFFERYFLLLKKKLVPGRPENEPVTAFSGSIDRGG